ncbi:lipopolysaccharide biosynthesis protein [Geomonas limicola]|nr:oligosaccharide flippase family protein [Geomonas limicola]
MLRKILNRITNNNLFLKNVLVMAGGTLLGQGLVIISSPVLTRLYSPDDFGVQASYVAVISVISVIASLHYELAIPLPKDDESAFNVVILALGIVAVLSVGVSVGLILFGQQFFELMHAPMLRGFQWLFPLTLLGTGIYQVFSYWAIRKNNYSLTSKTKVSQGFGQVGIQVGLSFFKSGPFGLILGQVFGQVLGAGVLARFAWNDEKRLYRSVSLDKLRSVGYQYRKFPLYASWSSLVNAVNSQAPVFILNYLYGSHVTGYYALGYRVLQIPLRLLGQSISQVFFNSTAQAHRDGKVDEITRNVFGEMVQYSVPVFLVLGLVAPELFAICFGPKWGDAGVYGQILLPWMFLVFISTPLSMLVSVLQKQGVELVFQISFLLLMVASFFVAKQLDGAYALIALISGAGSLCMAVKVGWLIKISGNSLYAGLLQIAKSFVFSLPVVILTLVAKNLHIYVVTITVAFLSLALALFVRYSSAVKKRPVH